LQSRSVWHVVEHALPAELHPPSAANTAIEKHDRPEPQSALVLHVVPALPADVDDVEHDARRRKKKRSVPPAVRIGAAYPNVHGTGWRIWIGPVP
jgi:hypothetical protein